MIAFTIRLKYQLIFGISRIQIAGPLLDNKRFY